MSRWCTALAASNLASRRCSCVCAVCVLWVCCGFVVCVLCVCCVYAVCVLCVYYVCGVLHLCSVRVMCACIPVIFTVSDIHVLLP